MLCDTPKWVSAADSRPSRVLVMGGAVVFPGINYLVIVEMAT
jgi:hypothetical protein